MFLTLPTDHLELTSSSKTYLFHRVDVHENVGLTNCYQVVIDIDRRIVAHAFLFDRSDHQIRVVSSVLAKEVLGHLGLKVRVNK